KPDAELAVDILSDILCNSAFDADELRREQHVIVQEIGASLDTREDRVFDFFFAGAFPEQPIGRTSLAAEATARRPRSQDLTTSLLSHYPAPPLVRPAPGALVHAALVTLAAGRFSSLPSADLAADIPARYRGGDIREPRDPMEAQLLL